MYSVGRAYLLWLCSGFGLFGLHRFYLGKIPTGILWMVTGGLFTIGSFYDFFTLPRQVHEANLRAALAENYNQRLYGRRNGGQQWRHVNDGEAYIVREKESLERKILKLAKQNKGIVSPSELALEADISIEESKKALEALIMSGIAELRVRKNGNLVYAFPDFMDANSSSDLEDF